MITTKTIKSFYKVGMLAALSIVSVSCNDGDDPDPTPGEEADKVYVLGLGVTTSTETTNYVLQTSDLLTGTLSLTKNGIQQTGYRDYTKVGSNFYSIGGLGVTDVNTLSLDASGKLVTKTGLTFPDGVTDFKDLDGTGKTLLSVSVPAAPAAGTNATFVTVDAATNAVSKSTTVPVNSIYPTSQDWLLHTGIVVNGSQAFQTFYPINAADFVTKNTDTAYVAVYSYPAFALQKVIKDARTGPAGSFNTRSGIFKTESGDIYTVSHTGYGYSKSTKDAGILKIANGQTVFDQSYYFNTASAANGGRIVHALYIGGNKLFAEIASGTQNGQWSDENLKFAIVDLSAKTITAVTNSPTFAGNGGRSFAAMFDDGKAYAAATVGGVCNIYQIDIATATAVKGAIVEASFVGAIERLK